MDSIANINQSYSDLNANRSVSNPNNNEMNHDSFLRLFIAAVQNQNPLEPMSQGEMMQQLTQLTMIENITKMSSAVDDLLNKEQGINPLSNYFDLVGKNVRVQVDGQFYEGSVLSVGRQNEDILFEMDNGEAYLVTDIVGISDVSSTENTDEDAEEVEETKGDEKIEETENETS